MPSQSCHQWVVSLHLCVLDAVWTNFWTLNRQSRSQTTPCLVPHHIQNRPECVQARWTVTPQIWAGTSTHYTHNAHSSLRYVLLMWSATCSVKGLNEFQTLIETPPVGWRMFGKHDILQTDPNQDQMARRGSCFQCLAYVLVKITIRLMLIKWCAHSRNHVWAKLSISWVCLIMCVWGDKI